MPKIRVLGLDIAAVNTGSAVVEAQHKSPNEFKVAVLEERHHRTVRVAKSQPPSWDSVCQVASDILSMAIEYEVGYIAYEGYARMARSNNTTAYEHAELVGVIKSGLFNSDLDLTFLQTPPTTLGSFFGVKSGNKKALQTKLQDLFDWKSQQRYVKWREDCSDAVGHAIIGSAVFLTLMGLDISGSLECSMQRVIYGDQESKQKLVSILKRPQLYIPRDACVGEYYDGEEVSDN